MSKEEVIHLEEGAQSYSMSLCYQMSSDAQKEVHKDFCDVLMSCVKELARRGGCHCTHITPDEVSGFALCASDISAINHAWDRIRQLIERLDGISAEQSSVLDYRIVLNGHTMHTFNKKIALSGPLQAELTFLGRCLG